MSEWIKMKERKPKTGQLCLVFAKSCDPKSPLRHISYWDETAGFLNLVPSWSESISHWMPFPKTPDGRFISTEFDKNSPLDTFNKPPTPGDD